jgi:hypothetical protein
MSLGSTRSGSDHHGPDHGTLLQSRSEIVACPSCAIAVRAGTILCSERIRALLEIPPRSRALFINGVYTSTRPNYWLPDLQYVRRLGTEDYQN